MIAVALSIKLPAVVLADDPRDDAALLSATLDGDRGAFTVLVRRHDPALRTMVTGMLRSTTSVDDILQDAYVKAFRALGTYRSGSVKAWLSRIAYTTTIDEIRRGQKVIPMDPSFTNPITSGSPRVDQRVTQRMDVLTALEQLTERQRAVALLVDGHGYDYAEVGRILDIPSGTVGFHLNKARKLLRAALSDSGADHA